MYNSKYIFKYLHLGESSTVSFLPGDVLSIILSENIVAMANTFGGTILIGINNGVIEGVPSSDNIYNIYFKLKEAFEELCSPPIKLDPQCIKNVNIKGKDIILVNIPMVEGENFYLASGKAIIRYGNKNIPLTLREIYLFSLTRIPLNFERLVDKRARLSDIDYDLVDRYREYMEEKFHFKINTPAINMLENMGCIIKDRAKMSLNNAAILLFSKTPQKFLPYSYISCIDFRNESNFIKKDFFGTLFSQVDDTVNFVIERISTIDDNYLKAILVSSQFSLRFKNIIREIIINAVSHRDYSIYGEKIYLLIFNDYLEIISPGGLIKFAKNNFMEFSRNPRNIIIYNLLNEYYHEDNQPPGLMRIKENCEYIGMEMPELLFVEGHFKALLWLNRRKSLISSFCETITVEKEESDITPVIEMKPLDIKELLPREETVIEYLKNNKSITRTQCEELLKIEPRTANRVLKSLLEKDRVIKEGSGTNFYYILKDER